ncbi:hypothetical protein BASA61_009300 [Batrachochytrium salamandrivorans]|nr:hypothetical protein BASA61_009300 [Batrachochytrium salamandrivorans]
MVAVSLFFVLALVSSTVVALPGAKILASLFSCFKPLATSKISTKSVYEWVPPSEEPITLTSDEDPVEIGLSYILQKLNLRSDEFKMKNNFTDHSGTTHMYGVPLYEGLPIGNLHAAVHVKSGQARYYSATIMDERALTKRSLPPPEPTAKISSRKAVKAAVDCLDVPFYDDIAPVMEYYETSDEHIPVWKFQLRDNPITQWFEVRVNANTAGAINAFYAANTFHDVLYQYGFTEPAGNYQKNNFEKGGIGGDPVVISVQNSKMTNNARFFTSPDGQPGVLALYLFTITEPNRDPALDHTVTIHELTHDLSDRLTGGAQTKGCMSKIESRGLSEGYSDIIAIIFTAKPEDTRNTIRVIGEYVEGDPRGSRWYPYTTDMKVNPLKYKDAMGKKKQHNLGKIWAVILFEVYWNLVDAYGFSTNLHDATQNKGNIIFLQILVGTLMIQPCNPTFVAARDAMLAADDAYYGGVHKHLIRKGFAKRGLGFIS